MLPMFKINKGNKGIIIPIVKINSPLYPYTYIKCLFNSHLYNLEAPLFSIAKGTFNY